MGLGGRKLLNWKGALQLGDTLGLGGKLWG